MNDISKECEKILADIRENLKGDKQKDIRYLMAMFKKYEKHPQAKVIQGECIRKMFELMTEEERAELLKKLTPDYSWVDKSLNEAVESINAGDIDKAVEIMEELVRRVEELDVYKDDDENEYHSFDEPFEEVLYRNVIKPKKNIRQAEIPYGQIYRLYGSLMIEKKKLMYVHELQHWLRKNNSEDGLKVNELKC